MSLYEITVADGHQDERGAVLLAVLGNPHVARFRDAWAEKGDDGPVIHLYTRTGGGNRACTCGEKSRLTHVPRNCRAAANEALQAHPLYLRDADDEGDGTYASFWFSAPAAAQVREALARIAVDPVDTAARWREATDRLQRGELRPAEVAMMDQFATMLSDPSPDAPRIMEV
jgi:hypothetical protein